MTKTDSRPDWSHFIFFTASESKQCSAFLGFRWSQDLWLPGNRFLRQAFFFSKPPSSQNIFPKPVQSDYPWRQRRQERAITKETDRERKVTSLAKVCSEPTTNCAMYCWGPFVILNDLSVCIHRKVHPSPRHGDWTRGSRFLTVHAEALRGSPSAAKQDRRLSRSLLKLKSCLFFPDAGESTTQTWLCSISPL